MSDQAERVVSILMLDNEYPPLGGGTGVVNRRILEEWARCGDVTVDLVTSSRTHDQYEYEDLSPSIRIHKVPVDNKNIHHSTNRELLTYAWRGWRYARKLVRRSACDVCLAWAGVPAGAIAMWLKWEFGLPYIVSLQGPDVPGFERRYRWVYLVLTPFIRMVWRQAAGLTACSEQHAELAHQTEPALPIRVIPNGVDASMFCPDARLHWDSEVVRLICVGRLIERKGQQHLIPAVAELKRQGLAVELLIVGTGDNEPALRRQVRELGLEDAVHFAGFVDWADMPQLYRASDVFVLPSYNEGMSIALLEAMATGLPVVVTNTGGARELANGSGMLVPWADVEQLAETLSKMIARPDLHRHMSQVSREVALQYSWQRVAQRYRDECRSVARM